MAKIATIRSRSGRLWNVQSYRDGVMTVAGQYGPFESSIRSAALFGTELVDCQSPALRKAWDAQIEKQHPDSVSGGVQDEPDEPEAQDGLSEPDRQQLSIV
ncbi:hypothetical protein [Acidithiobacillus caldus]|uniref:hypothetical protein n=1 Tax=Acidithiobacillus caldus TaxID=33059 RepID=UPI0007DA0427|nr:hypothetical protein [Acidithiobacillus caldus]QER43213.1 hypothetical protein F0726_00121 [Acidithiobacillus caldus]